MSNSVLISILAPKNCNNRKFETLWLYISFRVLLYLCVNDAVFVVVVYVGRN